MVAVASAVSLLLALAAAAWRPRRISPVGALLVLGVANVVIAVSTGGDLLRVLDSFRLHPILALVLGLVLGTLLDRAGALSTLAAGARGVGGAGALVFVIFLPLVLCLPCGHVIAAALAPVLPALCPEEGKAASTGVLAAAFARTAYGACGPAPAGGIGSICEGWLAQGWPAYQVGVLRAPQLVALVAAMPAAAWIARRAGAQGITEAFVVPKATARGALALFVFVTALLVALFRPLGRYEMELPLFAAAVVLWPLAATAEAPPTMRAWNAAMSPLIGVVIAFGAVGCVAAAGGLDSVARGLLAVPAAGKLGVVAAIALAPCVLPLPCGRILGYVLAPLLYGLGPAKGGALSWREVSVGMAVLATTLSTSCAHSPFCGGGMVVAHRASASRVLRSLAASLVVAVPCAALAAMPTLGTATWVVLLAAIGTLAGALLAGWTGFGTAKGRFQGAFGGLLGGALAGATLWIR